MRQIYENGQKVAYGWTMGSHRQWSDNWYWYRGETSLGDYILENPNTAAVFLAKQITAWED